MSGLNALQYAASSYLRSAMHQPVQWHEWSPEVFLLAVQQDKPILLDIGAVWCHWCHVMDRESYEDPVLAQIINEHYIAIKVDRDERPDVDSRYQAAVQAISGQGGWPLTAVLTPDGRPFFGGTYFPRDDRYGRPGFERVLRTLAEIWKSRREEALETAQSVLAAVEHGETFSGRASNLGPELVNQLVAKTLSQWDPRYGGFGSQPKFPHPAAVDLLLDVAARGHEGAKKVAISTLKKMAAGGIYDHLAGGFHRYSVDERWVVPHFEKMLYDNAELLKNYVHAFQTFVEPQFAYITRDIMRWMDHWLTDRTRGGFYASQDADISLEDDGDYFTWTREEAAAVLNNAELAVAEIYYDIGEMGDMHHNPKKNVLHVKHSIEEVAQKLSRDVSEVERDLASAKEKLYQARLQRPTPFIDKTIYTGWNALAVSAYLEADRVLQLSVAGSFALKTLNRILLEGWEPKSGLKHVIAYAAGVASRQQIAGVLDDYAFLIHACVDAWQATGLLRYFSTAVELADAMITRFYDETGGGFFDTETQSISAPGALRARRKPLQDTPTPAGNPAAAAALLRLEALSGRADFREKAEDTLEHFGGIVEQFGLFAGTYGLALQRLLLPPLQVVIIGEDERAKNLAAMATARYAVNKSVILLRPDQITEQNLPPVLAATLPGLPKLHSGDSFAIVCKGNTCLPPVRDAEELLQELSGV
jgi:uncharacterized protein YyaL (SSP411 family)